jgi:serine/threonine protein kinase
MTFDHLGGRINWDSFKFNKVKSHGSEGTCYHVHSRAHRCDFAIIKKARVKVDNDGIHYCFIRELAALKQLKHTGICELVKINLANSKLHLFFPYVELTLENVLRKYSDQGRCISKHYCNRFLGQLLETVDYCHGKGIVHRNLKPKHILFIPGHGHDMLEGATLKLADFAYVRMMPCQYEYSTRVITLWYRCPEILLGKKDYTSAVDIWSVGCIYAEMLHGHPLFAGLSEIDQLFKIFSKLGTPSQEDWAEFHALPHYQENLFPMFEGSKLDFMGGVGDEEMTILEKFFKYDSIKRATAAELLSDHSLLLGTSGCNENAAVGDMIIRQYSFLCKLDICDHRHDPVTEADRLILVEWLIAVMHSFTDDIEIHELTVFFSVALFDKYLSVLAHTQRLQDFRENIRLIGATCLLIASKCEDVSFLTVNHLAERSMDSELDEQSMLLMEESILNCLDFDLYIPTVMDFLNIFLAYVREVDLIEALKPFTSYLAEATLLCKAFVGIKKSTIAAAIVSYSLDVFATYSWPLDLENVTHIHREDFQQMYNEIKSMHTSLHGRANSVVHEHYLDLQRFQVALINPLP